MAGQAPCRLNRHHGATWAVKLALTGAVDAAVAIGGPVEMAFDISSVQNWPNGMSGIMSNSLHRDTPFAGATPPW